MKNIFLAIFAFLVVSVNAQHTNIYRDSTSQLGGFSLSGNFSVFKNAHYGYVLTSDSFGHITLQPSSGGGGGYWTEGAGALFPTNINDLVGIGTAMPSFNLQVAGSFNTAQNATFSAASLQVDSNGLFAVTQDTSGLSFFMLGNYDNNFGFNRDAIVLGNAHFTSSILYGMFADNDSAYLVASSFFSGNTYGIVGAHNYNTYLDVADSIGRIYSLTSDEYGVHYEYQDTDRYTLPLRDGNNGDVVATDGNGHLSLQPSNSWSLTGNSNTNDTTNFIGTTDGTSSGLEFRVNNTFAGELDTTDTENTSFGYLSNDNRGNNNTAIGVLALSVITGSGNTAVGSQALQSSGNISGNTGIGSLALNSLTTGNLNTALGSFSSAFNLITGNYNTSLGAGAGPNSDLSNTTCVGANSATDLSNTVILGNNCNTFIGRVQSGNGGANGFILQDSNGVCWLTKVNTSGVLVTSSTPCP